MAAWLASSLPVFVGLTVVLFGAAAWMMGRAIAETWRPRWQLVPYAILLASANRFLAFALFEERLLAPIGFVVDTAVLLAIAALSWRIAHAAKMVRQYPWLYERRGPWGFRSIDGRSPG